MESSHLPSIFKILDLSLKEIVNYCPCIGAWTEQTLSTSKGLKGNCTICSEQGLLCIFFLPKADCNSASQFSALLSVTLGRCLTACSHPCHTHSLTPLASGRCMGDEGSLLSVSYPLLPCSYLDSSGVNPCSPHRKPGICMDLFDQRN